MMSKMTEAELSRIDNLEIGSYKSGSVKWPGVTDVRGLDFDKIIVIEADRVTMYPDQEKPEIGTEINKEAVITLNVPFSRLQSKSQSGSRTGSLENLKAKLSKYTEKELGGTFIDYDGERWIFRVPHCSAGGSA